ncbi:MAG: hypothetical protein IRY99_16030 [Isosphaeraceae bacterium]|nr:hypothetical protein [Isosphaeraceae bacterium]
MLRPALLALCLLALSLPAFGQGSDAALKDRVAQLVERLNAPKAEAADAAEKALIKLGPRILPLLPDPTKPASAKAKERLARIRSSLVEEQESANLGPSKITIQAKGMRLSEALKQLQVQSGNRITDLREQMGGDVTNPALDLDIRDKPFFEALDLVVQKAGVGLNFYTGDGTIGLVPGPGVGEGGEAKPDQIGAEPFRPLIAYAGPFRIAFRQLIVARDLQSGGGSANAQFEVAWEPRLRPMLMALKPDQIEIVDDQGNTVAPTLQDDSARVVLRPENPVAELNLNMEAPERAALKLTKLKVQGEVTVPAGLKQFKFPTLAAKDLTKQQGNIAVTLEETEVDESVWKVRVTLSMPGEGEAFESYRSGLFNNRIWLQKADGSRFEHNGGFNSLNSAGGRMSFEYLFVDAPGQPKDYAFVYETPSKVLPIPLEFEFKDVPLP